MGCRGFRARLQGCSRASSRGLDDGAAWRPTPWLCLQPAEDERRSGPTGASRGRGITPDRNGQCTPDAVARMRGVVPTTRELDPTNGRGMEPQPHGAPTTWSPNHMEPQPHGAPATRGGPLESHKQVVGWVVTSAWRRTVPADGRHSSGASEKRRGL